MSDRRDLRAFGAEAGCSHRDTDMIGADQR
jgi:hypothetical protein